MQLIHQFLFDKLSHSVQHIFQTQLLSMLEELLGQLFQQKLKVLFKTWSGTFLRFLIRFLIKYILCKFLIRHIFRLFLRFLDKAPFLDSWLSFFSFDEVSFLDMIRHLSKILDKEFWIRYLFEFYDKSFLPCW